MRPSIPSTTCILLSCVVTGIAWSSTPLYAQDETDNARAELPKYEDMVLPDARELMTADPFDWVVLRDGTVLVTEPVYPRPDTLTKMAQERGELETARGGTAEERSERNKRKAELQYLNVILLDDQSEDYRLPVSQIEIIKNFEHLMLDRADKLIEAGEIATAYDLLLEVEKMAPGWKETAPRLDQLLIREAELRIADGNHYAALALMDELAAGNSPNPDLPIRMGEVIDGLVKTAVNAGDAAQAQYFVARLKNRFPEHSVVTHWEDRFRNEMTELLTKAKQQADAGEHAAAAVSATEANRIWPVTGNLRETYRQIVFRYQTLRVAVREFSGKKVVSPVILEPEKRDRELTTVLLFEPSSADELTYFQSSYFDLWEPKDLGREVVFSIRKTRPYWQSQPLLSANQIADTLSDQLNPDLASFNPRLASFIKAFAVRSPTELQVSFTRVPLNLEALFRFPVMGIPEDNTASLHEAPRELLSRRFELVEQDESQRIYRRTIPEPDGLLPNQYHVSEIVEKKYPDRHAELQAFNRGNVDVLPHLRPWEVDIFKATGRSFVQQYILPQTHVLVFNPLSTATENPQIRRALSFGVDRESLLKNVILRDPDMKYGRPARAPWHSGSYANSPLVDPPRYDMYLSYILRMAAQEKLRIPEKQKFVADAKAAALSAKEEWDELIFRRDHADEIKAVAAHIKLPVLRFVVESDDVAMLAAEQMMIRWKALGFEIELIPANQEGETLADGEWDFMYRSVRLHEPLLDLWSLMLTDEEFDVTRLASYPDWMRQELINLDYATSFLDAQKRLFTIHRHMAAQAFIVPLWELDDFIAFQGNISDFEGRPLSVYHNVERWQVKP